MRLWQYSFGMKSNQSRFAVLTLLFLLTRSALTVSGIAQDTKYYRHDSGRELSIWYDSSGNYALNLESLGIYYSADLPATETGNSGAERAVVWIYYDDRGGEHDAGPGTVRASEQSVVLLITEGTARGQVFHGQANPSGTYRRLSEADRLKFAREEYAAADAELNRVYGEMRQRLKDKQELWADLQKRQRDWIGYRDNIAEHPATVGSGKPGGKDSSVEYWQIMASMTETQTGFLKIFTGDAVPDGPEGQYIDGAGGRLTIRNATVDGFDFAINVVRGPTAHLGDLEGHARVGADGVALFVDTDKEAFVDGKPCTLRFEFDGKRIQLSGENTMFYHGARAFFDGEYFKEVDLPAAARR